MTCRASDSKLCRVRVVQISSLLYLYSVVGAFMMPSNVLSYIQMGQFLMLVMTVSWLFSVFYFQSLCATIGPQGNMGSFEFKRFCCRNKLKKEDLPEPKPWDLQSMDEKEMGFDNIDDNETDRV